MRETPKKLKGTAVSVKDGNVEKALRKFKNKIQDSGKLEEVRERMEYVKPCVARVIRENKARRRWLKKVADDELAGLRPSPEGKRKRLY